MITITNREAVQTPDSITALFTGGRTITQTSRSFGSIRHLARAKSFTGIPTPKPGSCFTARPSSIPKLKIHGALIRETSSRSQLRRFIVTALAVTTTYG